jgi:hypothetical protein
VWEALLLDLEDFLAARHHLEEEVPHHSQEPSLLQLSVAHLLLVSLPLQDSTHRALQDLAVEGESRMF